MSATWFVNAESADPETVADFLVAKSNEWSIQPLQSKYFDDERCKEVSEKLWIKLSIQTLAGPDLAIFEDDVSPDQYSTCFNGFDWINGFVLLREKGFQMAVRSYTETGMQFAEECMCIVQFETGSYPITCADFQLFCKNIQPVPAQPSSHSASPVKPKPRVAPRYQAQAAPQAPPQSDLALKLSVTEIKNRLKTNIDKSIANTVKALQEQLKESVKAHSASLTDALNRLKESLGARLQACKATVASSIDGCRGLTEQLKAEKTSLSRIATDPPAQETARLNALHNSVEAQRAALEESKAAWDSFSSQKSTTKKMFIVIPEQNEGSEMNFLIVSFAKATFLDLYLRIQEVGSQEPNWHRVPEVRSGVTVVQVQSDVFQGSNFSLTVTDSQGIAFTTELKFQFDERQEPEKSPASIPSSFGRTLPPKQFFTGSAAPAAPPGLQEQPYQYEQGGAPVQPISQSDLYTALVNAFPNYDQNWIWTLITNNPGADFNQLSGYISTINPSSLIQPKY